MRIKNTAFIYNVTVNGTSNCDWGTDIGQSSKHTFTLKGFSEIANAMLYYRIENPENIEVVLGKGNKTPKKIDAYKDVKLVLASCFTKVFLNGKKLDGQKFVMYILKETNKYNSKGQINVHQNRCTLKFSNSLLYNGEKVNQNCIDAISNAFGVGSNGSWAILDIDIKNEDELHFSGFVLANTSKNYPSTEARNNDFAELYDHITPLFSKPTTKLIDHTDLEEQQYNYISAIKAKPFLILGGFSGTGKSQQVKELAFAACPCDGILNTSETSPGNYLLVSVKPNWHDASDITGFRSSVNKNYYVTDFMRFLVKAKAYESKKVPFFVCLDEMNLAPVEEYFADFLSVIESRKRTEDGRIVTDPIVPASVFNDTYSDDFNIFIRLGLQPVSSEWKEDEINALDTDDKKQAFIRQDIVDELMREGLTIPQNVIIIGTVNMDDTTNTFSRKVIDRAMTFETIVNTFGLDYFEKDVPLHYVKNPLPGEYFISDEVRATQMIESGRFSLTEKEEQDVLAFINGINKDMEGTPFKISYRILNETILLYHSKRRLKELLEENGDSRVTIHDGLNTIFDDILMQKVLPRIEGDYDKCCKCLTKLSSRCAENSWNKSEDKIEFMIERFGKDKSGFTSFWN